MERIKSKKQWLWLILLCWFTYVSSYMGRYSYNANINPIMEEYGLLYSEAGLVTTFFFFAYGIGQIFNGIMCRRYNKRYTVAIALIVASVCNVLPFIGIPFEMFKFVWMVNGIAQSFLWTSIIYSLGTSLDSKRLPTATFLMASTVAIGTLAAYGFSAIFTAIGAYKFIFLTGSVMLGTMGIVWFLTFDKLTTNTIDRSVKSKVAETGKKRDFGLFAVVALLALFAIINNFIKDGLTAWAPTIFKENYGFDDSFSLLLTLCLPVIGFMGQFVNVRVQRKIKDFVSLTGLWFFLAAIMLACIILLLGTNGWVFALVCFCLTSSFMLNVNNIVTNMAPLYMRDRANPGLLAGLLDGFCYLGSTISTYGLGLIRDNADWSTVFIILCITAFVPVGITVGYKAVNAIMKKQSGASPAVSKKTKVKAIIFDLDGTLLNTLDDLHISVNIMLEQNGFATRSYDEIRSFVGNGVAKLVERALPNGKDENFEKYLAQFKSIYDEHKNDNTAPYAGVMELLREVKSHGYKSAIVSNKYDEAVQQLKNETFEGLVDFALGEGNGIATKPAPDGVWLALEKLGVCKDESVYVGDSEVDLLTAKNAGLECIAVTWGFRDEDFLIDNGAKHIVRATNELLPLLESDKFSA